MKDPADTVTEDLIPSPKKRGRPASGKAMTPAERKAAQRERDRETAGMVRDAPHKVPPRVITQTLERESGTLAFMAWLELGERRGWITAAERIAIARNAR